MSSSNRVAIVYIPQVTKGLIPAGNLTAMRYINESLNGEPATVESQAITTDRQPQGQVVVGMSAKGQLGFELSRSKDIDDLLEAAMYSSWTNALVLAGLELAVNASTKEITRAAGDFVADGLKAGDIIQLSGFANSKNNTVVQIKAIEAGKITYIGSDAMVDEVADADNDETITRPSYLDIGTTRKLFAISKEYEDVGAQSSILYKDAIVDGFSLDIAHSALATISFDIVSGYEIPDVKMSDSRVIDSVGAPTPINGSADAGKVTVADEVAPYCIKSLKIGLRNNNTEKNNLGEIAAADHNEGGTNISVELGAYLEQSNFNLLKNKSSQVPFGTFFYAKNADGGYAVALPAVQVSMDDPSVQGGNQQMMMDLKGTAKIGANKESALRIYRLD